MEVADDLLGEQLVVAVHEAQGDEAGDEEAEAFQGFKSSDGTEGLLGGGLHEPPKVEAFGMTERKKPRLASRLAGTA